MSTKSRGNGSQTDFKSLSIFLLGLLIAIDCAKATVDYAAFRKDTVAQGTTRESARTTRNILEDYLHRDVTSVDDIQQASEHLLQYGALLRTQILDTFGKLVYDHYDDFGMTQIEALYRVYRETLERKYNIFDIVPSVLNDSDTSPTKICGHINEHVRTCLKESSKICTNVKFRDEPNVDAIGKSVIKVTRRIYKSARIPTFYPRGFSSTAVLNHLRSGDLSFTPAIFSGLLHNVQYDSFDDKVRTAEREIVGFLTKIRDRFDVEIERVATNATTIGELLGNYLTMGEKIFTKKISRQANLLAEHVVREVDAISENIELLGTVYDNSTINLDYLFKLILPNDTMDSDVLDARDYLLRRINDLKIVNNYLRIEKYQQTGPDQLIMEIFGQLRDIHFAEDIVTSLYAHARFWHKSHMIKNRDDLLELFDAYENLRGIPERRQLIDTADAIKHALLNSQNVTVELLCSKPRACLRIGLEMIRKCDSVSAETKLAIDTFIDRSCECSCDNDSKIPMTNDTLLLTEIETSTVIGSANLDNDVYRENREIIIDSTTSSTLAVDNDLTDDATDSDDSSASDEEENIEKIPKQLIENPCNGNCTVGECNGANCPVNVDGCIGGNCSSNECTGKDCPLRANCTGLDCIEEPRGNECEGSECADNGTTEMITTHCTDGDCSQRKCIDGNCSDDDSLSDDDCEGPDCLASCEGEECLNDSEIVSECDGPDCQNKLNATSDCEGFNCLDKFDARSVCKGPDCQAKSSETSDCEGPDCQDKSSETSDCEGPNCQDKFDTTRDCKGPHCKDTFVATSDCEGLDCQNKPSEMSDCKGPDCENKSIVISNCEGPDCEHDSEKNQPDSLIQDLCHGSNCSDVSCVGNNCGINATQPDCIGADCSSSSCEGSDCRDKSVVGSDCEGPDCQGTSTVSSNCVGPDCQDTSTVSSNCVGPDCQDTSTVSSDCVGPDCEDESEVKPTGFASRPDCAGLDCSNSSCEGENCQKNSTVATDCVGPDCQDKPTLIGDCEGADCQDKFNIESDCVGPDCQDKPPLIGDCEGADCQDKSSIESDCVGPDCQDKPTLIGNCEGADCQDKSSIESDCVGPDCQDKPTLIGDCEGADCQDKSSIESDCVGPDCQDKPTVVSNCEGPNCGDQPATVGDCVGSDCQDTSVSLSHCEGPDCQDKSTVVGDCEGPNCGDKPATAGGCVGSACQNNSDAVLDCEGLTCQDKSFVTGNCEGPDCQNGKPTLVSDCEGPDCHHNPIVANDCNGPNCTDNSVVNPTVPVEQKQCPGPNCTEATCLGNNCGDNITPFKCEGSNCQNDSPPIGTELVADAQCDGPNCLDDQITAHCNGSECFVQGESKCGGTNCSVEPTKMDCETGNCQESDSPSKINPIACHGPNCVDNSCTGTDCPNDDTIVNCTGTNCSDVATIECNGSDCSDDGSVECQGPECLESDCTGPNCVKSETAIDCVGSDCPDKSTGIPKSVNPNGCEGPDCSDDSSDEGSDCEDENCSDVSSTINDGCKGAGCERNITLNDFTDKGIDHDCEGADCKDNVETPCNDADCSVDHSAKVDGPDAKDRCGGENCTSNTVLPTDAEKQNNVSSATPTESPIPLTSTVHPHNASTLCGNRDPHYRRQLNRLQKMRRVDAESSTPRSSSEDWSALFGFEDRKGKKIAKKIRGNSNTNINTNVNGKLREKYPLLQSLGNAGTKFRRTHLASAESHRRNSRGRTVDDTVIGANKISQSSENVKSTNEIKTARTEKHKKKNVSDKLTIEKIQNIPSHESSVKLEKESKYGRNRLKKMSKGKMEKLNSATMAKKDGDETVVDGESKTESTNIQKKLKKNRRRNFVKQKVEETIEESADEEEIEHGSNGKVKIMQKRLRKINDKSKDAKKMKMTNDQETGEKTKHEVRTNLANVHQRVGKNHKKSGGKFGKEFIIERDDDSKEVTHDSSMSKSNKVTNSWNKLSSKNTRKSSVESETGNSVEKTVDEQNGKTIENKANEKSKKLQGRWKIIQRKNDTFLNAKYHDSVKSSDEAIRKKIERRGMRTKLGSRGFDTSEARQSTRTKTLRNRHRTDYKTREKSDNEENSRIAVKSRKTADYIDDGEEVPLIYQAEKRETEPWVMKRRHVIKGLSQPPDASLHTGNPRSRRVAKPRTIIEDE